LPVDTVIACKFVNDADEKDVTSGEIPLDWKGLDIVPKSVALFQEGELCRRYSEIRDGR